MTVSMSLTDDFELLARRPRVFRPGATGIEATYYVTLKAGRAALDARVALKESKRLARSITSTGRARRSRRDRTRTRPKDDRRRRNHRADRGLQRRRDWSASLCRGRRELQWHGHVAGSRKLRYFRNWPTDGHRLRGARHAGRTISGA